MQLSYLLSWIGNKLTEKKYNHQVLVFEKVMDHQHGIHNNSIVCLFTLENSEYEWSSWGSVKCRCDIIDNTMIGITTMNLKQLIYHSKGSDHQYSVSFKNKCKQRCCFIFTSSSLHLSNDAEDYYLYLINMRSSKNTITPSVFNC
jgi:hypothetical protein